MNSKTLVQDEENENSLENAVETCPICRQTPSEGPCPRCTKNFLETYRWLERTCPTCGDVGRRLYPQCREHYAEHRAAKAAAEAKRKAKEDERLKKMLTITHEERVEMEKVAFGMGIQPTAEAEPEVDGLKYPQLRFPYEAIPEGRLKKLVDKACEGGVAPGLVVPSLLTLIGSMPTQDKMCGQRINLFTTL